MRIGHLLRLLPAAAILSTAACQHSGDSSAVLDRGVQDAGAVDARSIYNALAVEAVDTSGNLPGASPSFRKQAGRLTCTFDRIPEEVYHCALGAAIGSDREIYDRLDVRAIPSRLPGAAHWTKNVGGLTCVLDANAGNIYACSLASQSPGGGGGGGGGDDANQPIRVSNSRAVYDALEVPPTNTPHLPGGALAQVKQAGRLTCTLIDAHQPVYDCQLAPTRADDRVIYDRLNINPTASTLPGAATWTKTVGGLACTLDRNASPNGIAYCTAR